MNDTKNQHVFECERSLQEVIETLENLFKEHYRVFQSTVGIQRDVIDAMWVLSQRFLILTRGALCVRPYPREPSDREERETSAEFKLKKHLLHESNTKLNASLHNVKEKCVEFDRAMAKVDASLPNQIVDADTAGQSIYYYIDLFADFFNFFHQIQIKFNLLGAFLMVEDISSILEYKQLLEPRRVIHEYFEH